MRITDGLRVSLVTAIVLASSRCYAFHRSRQEPFLVEVLEAGSRDLGFGIKGGGYGYVQVLLYDNGTCRANGLSGSLLHPLSPVSYEGTWRTNTEGHVMLKLGRKGDAVNRAP